MLYARRDFRPDHLPRLMSNMARGWSVSTGWFETKKSSRRASVNRQDYKNEHQGRQRTYDRKVIREAWSEALDGDGE